MQKRYLGFLGVLFSLVFVLAACTVSGQTTPATQNAQGTPLAGNNLNAFGTPVDRGLTSPSASPATGQNLQATSLATAMKNLENQQSYVMTAKVLNVHGAIAAFSGNLPEATMTIMRNGSNRHMTLSKANGDTVLEMWLVNGKVYADLGNGPTQISSNNSLVSQFADMLTSDQMIFGSLESREASYTVVGTASFNGVDTKVETAQYQLQSQANNNLFFGNMNGTITSKIWVAQNDNYLIKGDFMLNAGANGNLNGTPVSGSSTSSTPSVNAGGEVMITISNVNNTPEIQAPTS